MSTPLVQIAASGQNGLPVTSPEGKTFYLETFGCQMNVHDSEKVAGLLVTRGYRRVASYQEADLVFYNTCSIREKAAQKVFSRLGVFKEDPGLKEKFIGVLGCVAQQEGEEIFKRAPHVNLVCGSSSYTRLPEILSQIEAGKKRITGLSLDVDECFETEITRRDRPYRAYLTIIEGCDKNCAYCVVPMTRGGERSRPSDKVLEDCRRLVEEGYTEIQLLGQNVNSYRDPSPAGWSFAELLARVGEVDGLRRVRFTTSHPRDFHPEIVEAIATHPVLCDHVHLPVQSGSNRILSRMLRDYTREEYLEKIDCIRNAGRAISISTDLIVGFPGETREDFEQTLSLVDEVGYDSAFSFKYSPRPKTGALGLGDPVGDEEKRLRLGILQDRQRAIQLQRNDTLIGQTFEVLVEGRQKREGQLTGHTSSHRVVNFLGDADWLGHYVDVRITSAGPNSLVGEVVRNAAG